MAKKPKLELLQRYLRENAKASRVAGTSKGSINDMLLTYLKEAREEHSRLIQNGSSL